MIIYRSFCVAFCLFICLFARLLVCFGGREWVGGGGVWGACGQGTGGCFAPEIISAFPFR